MKFKLSTIVYARFTNLSEMGNYIFTNETSPFKNLELLSDIFSFSSAFK